MQIYDSVYPSNLLIAEIGFLCIFAHMVYYWSLHVRVNTCTNQTIVNDSDSIISEIN